MLMSTLGGDDGGSYCGLRGDEGGSGGTRSLVGCTGSFLSINLSYFCILAMSGSSSSSLSFLFP